MDAITAALALGGGNGGGGGGAVTSVNGQVGDVVLDNTDVGVTGTNDGTNWQTLTLGDVTKNIPDGLPAYSASDANKKLSVNSAGTGVEWQEVSSGGSLYMHKIKIMKVYDEEEAYLFLYLSDQTPINSLADLIRRTDINYFTNYPCVGWARFSGTREMVFSFRIESNTEVQFQSVTFGHTATFTPISVTSIMVKQV